MTDPTTQRRCHNCKWILYWDHGYSDWTVEGTHVLCLMVPDPPFNGVDGWYGNWEGQEYAEQCQHFKPQKFAPPHINVDCEQGKWIYHIDDPEARAVAHLQTHIGD